MHTLGDSLAVTGSALALLGLFELLIWPLAGGILLLLAAALWLCGRFWPGTRAITCGPGGFTVESRSRRFGRRREEYGWHEVSRTAFQEPGRRRWGGGGAARFLVETARGPAFAVSLQTRHVQDLIEVFNAMTSHLPYVWQQGAPTPAAAVPGSYRMVPRSRSGRLSGPAPPV